MSSRLKKAADVLPADLLRQVEAAISERLGPASVGLWFKGDHQRAVESRARAVVEMTDHGRSPAEIAERVGITRRRVDQIMKAHRDGKLPTMPRN